MMDGTRCARRRHKTGGGSNSGGRANPRCSCKPTGARHTGRPSEAPEHDAGAPAPRRRPHSARNGPAAATGAGGPHAAHRRGGPLLGPGRRRPAGRRAHRRRPLFGRPRARAGGAGGRASAAVSSAVCGRPARVRPGVWPPVLLGERDRAADAAAQARLVHRQQDRQQAPSPRCFDLSFDLSLQGTNGYGQLGSAAPPPGTSPAPVAVAEAAGWAGGGPAAPIERISAGAFHSCLLDADGAAFCFGGHGNTCTPPGTATAQRTADARMSAQPWPALANDRPPNSALLPACASLHSIRAGRNDGGMLGTGDEAEGMTAPS